MTAHSPDERRDLGFGHIPLGEWSSNLYAQVSCEFVGVELLISNSSDGFVPAASNARDDLAESLVC